MKCRPAPYGILARVGLHLPRSDTGGSYIRLFHPLLLSFRGPAMATRDFRRALTICLSAAALLGAGMLIGRTTILAADRPSVLLMPAPAECAAAWQKDLKLAIE